MASAEFEAAVAAVGTLRKDPGNETKLRLSLIHISEPTRPY